MIIEGLIEHIVQNLGLWASGVVGVGSLGLGAMELRNRFIFAPKTLVLDVAKVGKLVQSHETRLDVMEANDVHRDKMLEELIAKPIQRITQQLDVVINAQAEDGKHVAALKEGQRGVSEAIKDIRAQMNRLHGL